MKSLIFAWCFFTITSLHAQVKSQFLSSYSYKIVAGYHDKITGTGTGFFYKKDKQTWLYSNFHVLKGHDPITMTKRFDIDRIGIHIKTKNGEPFFIDLPFTPKINSKERGVLDIQGIKITGDLRVFSINYINDLIDKNFLKSIPDHLICYGYPDSDKDFFTPTLLTGLYERNLKESVSSIPFPDTNTRDLFLQNRTGIYYLLSSMSENGMSGSPVFACFSRTKRNHSERYVFWGIMAGNNSILKKSWCLNPEVAINFLETASN